MVDLPASPTAFSGRAIVKRELLAALTLLPILAGAYNAFATDQDDLCFAANEVVGPDLAPAEKEEIRQWAEAGFEPTVDCLVVSSSLGSESGQALSTALGQCRRARVALATLHIPTPTDEGMQTQLGGTRDTCLRSLDAQLHRLARPRSEGVLLHGAAHLRVCIRLINRSSRAAGQDLVLPSCETGTDNTIVARKTGTVGLP